MSIEGEAGRSARRQFKKKIELQNQKRLKAFGPKIGKLLNRILGDSHAIQAWEKGTVGENIVGNFLNHYSEEKKYFVLHDRRLPNSRANIDHILISDRGIFVIDAKNYEGLISIRESGSFINDREELFVGNRNQTKLITGIKKQMSAVEELLNRNGLNIKVHGVLAFVNADFPVFFKPKSIDDVLINGQGLAKTIESQKSVEGLDLPAIFEILKEGLREY